MKMMEKSCGTVLFTIVEDEPRYVLVRDKRGHFGFPKGHREQGESERVTALRETWEETSIRTPKILPDFREETVYSLPRGNKKSVVYFLAEYKGQTPKHNEDFEPLTPVIFTYKGALRALRYENMRAILRHANEVVLKYISDKKENESLHN